MATRRMLPTKFFKDPDVMALSSSDTRLILIGLVLNADDAGRELAHIKLLGRELDYEPTVVEQALDELAVNDLITLYQVGKHRYYSLQRWHEWQTLSKPTPSKYPAPPCESKEQAAQENTVPSIIPQENPGEFGETPSEGEEELEENRKEDEEEGTPSNIVTFPTSHIDDTAAGNIHQITMHVATILKLTLNDALQRVIVDYSCIPAISLLGEADAAREWIDDRKRNRKGQRMTPAFFRRWLRREQEALLQREAQRQHQSATGTHGRETLDAPTSKPTSPVPRLPQSLMDLETKYHNAQSQGGTS